MRLVLHLLLSAYILIMVTSVPAIAKPKRFRFLKDFDIALLRCVSSNEERLVAHGKTEEKSSRVLIMFLATP